MNPIPLESDLNWWWYKAKLNLIKLIIKDLNFSKSINILEIGPGRGNNINYLNNIGEVDILEIDEEFVNHLKTYNKKEISKYFMDINEVDKKYDLILLLDVLEHIENSEEYMSALTKYLKKEGIVIIGVPAYKSLWSIHDEKLLHFRRYNWKKLYSDCQSYKILKRYGFNYLLFPIRYMQIKLMKNVQTTNETNRQVNGFLYLISLIENCLRLIGFNPKFGISLYAVVQKRQGKNS